MPDDPIDFVSSVQEVVVGPRRLLVALGLCRSSEGDHSQVLRPIDWRGAALDVQRLRGGVVGRSLAVGVGVGVVESLLVSGERDRRFRRGERRLLVESGLHGHLFAVHDEAVVALPRRRLLVDVPFRRVDGGYARQSEREPWREFGESQSFGRESQRGLRRAGGAFAQERFG